MKPQGAFTWWWLLLAAVLAIASAAALALLVSPGVIPSIVLDPLSDFVQPGVTVWWFVLGGPFRNAPSSSAGIAFAAATNAVAWVLMLRLLVIIVGLVRRMVGAPRS
jgi:hypothetical protein